METKTNGEGESQLDEQKHQTEPEQQQQQGEADGQQGEQQQEAQPESDPLLNAILDGLNQALPEADRVKPAVESGDVDDAEKKDDEVKPEEKKEDEAKTEVEPEKPRAKKTVVVKKPDLTTAPPIPEEEPKVVPKPEPQDSPDADQDYIKSLTEEQQEEIREMEVAERLYPDRYKGKRKQLVEFFKSLDTKAPTIQVEQGEAIEDNAEFKRLLDAKPKMTPLDAKRVNRAIGEESATAKVKAELAPEIEDNKIRLRELEVRPEVISEVQKLEKEVNAMFTADSKSPLHEVSKAFAEKGAKAIEENPEYQLEAQIAGSEMAHSKRLMAEYLLFQKQARRFDSNNPVHMELFEFIEKQGDALQADGGLVRGGKRFLTRSQYAQHVSKVGADAAAKKYFTFTGDDIKKLIVEDTKIRIEHRVKNTIQENERLGFVRQPKQKSTETRTEKQPITPPKAAPTISKGAAEAQPVRVQTAGVDVMSTLGYDRLVSAK